MTPCPYKFSCAIETVTVQFFQFTATWWTENQNPRTHVQALDGTVALSYVKKTCMNFTCIFYRDIKALTGPITKFLQG